MRVQVARFWELLRASYWFVPGLMTLGGIGLSFGMLELDRAGYEDVLQKLGWVYGGGAEGARLMLSAVASSMITVAGVVFSINIVALTLASGQFGPRLLRNFIRDTGNQVVLGTFVSTFLYCLLVLRAVRGAEDSTFVPHISVTFAVLLAVLNIGVLIYFIHHVAVAIQAQNVIAAVARELDESIETLFPEEFGQPALREAAEADTAGELPAGFEQESHAVPAGHSGYLQTIDDARLMELAEEHDLLLRLELRPGDFVIAQGPLALAWSARGIDAKLLGRLGGCFAVGESRSPVQDVEFSVLQLVEIAVRALSPGINDPFTAIGCIDWLGAALSRMARRRIPSPLRRDKAGRLRVIAHGLSFPEFADAAFRQLRQYGSGSTAVLIRMLETIRGMAPQVRRPEDRAALVHHVELIERDGRESLRNEWDRADLEKHCRQALDALRMIGARCG